MSSILKAPQLKKTLFKVAERGDKIVVEMDKPTFEQMARKIAMMKRMM